MYVVLVLKAKHGIMDILWLWPKQTTVVLCEIITVSVENRDMFTSLLGVKISCKATVTSLPLVKENLLILGRNHPRTSLEASAKYRVDVSNIKLWSGGVLHVREMRYFTSQDAIMCFACVCQRLGKRC